MITVLGFSTMELMRNKLLLLTCFCLSPAICFGAPPLVVEPFEDNNFTSRGWYDSTGGVLDSSEHVTGSTASFRCTFLQGQQGCSGGSPARHLFTPTDSVYVSFWIKYSSNYAGSGQRFHPHEFYLLTNLNGAYNGLAWTYLTAYIEQNVQSAGGVPRLSIQDGQNIDETTIGTNLVGVTENRSVAGCNGDSDGYGNGECYLSGSVHWNGKTWEGAQAYFTNTQGPYYKNDWHFVEVHIKLNSIANGIGQKDGILKYSLDSKPIIDVSNAVLRTGKNSSMQFNQFVIGPYIGPGSPVTQSFWIDNLTVATAPPDSSAPAPPQNLRVN